ncbi:MAG: hypothetical protein J7L66_01555 [Anaerolineaceae bacterium]|nr:hypothetical protein [Anaerolineaceae bacterium]
MSGWQVRLNWSRASTIILENERWNMAIMGKNMGDIEEKGKSSERVAYRALSVLKPYY